MKKIYAFFTITCLAIFYSTLSKADETSLLFAQKSLTPAAALKVAQATMEACRKAGFQAAVAVVDRGGNMQVMLRDSLLRRLQLLKIEPLKKLIS